MLISRKNTFHFRQFINNLRFQVWNTLIKFEKCITEMEIISEQICEIINIFVLSQ